MFQQRKMFGHATEPQSGCSAPSNQESLVESDCSCAYRWGGRLRKMEQRTKSILDWCELCARPEEEMWEDESFQSYDSSEPIDEIEATHQLNQEAEDKARLDPYCQADSGFLHAPLREGEVFELPDSPYCVCKARSVLSESSQSSISSGSGSLGAVTNYALHTAPEDTIGSPPGAIYGDQDRYHGIGCLQSGTQVRLDYAEGATDGWFELSNYRGRPLPKALLAYIPVETGVARAWTTGARDQELPDHVWELLRDWHAEVELTLLEWDD